MPSYIGKSGTFSLMKNLNLEKVFRTIVLHAPVSRAEISRLTGLNKVTVSNCVRTLTEANLVSEEGIVSSENGRPPMMLMLSQTYGIIIGADLSSISTNIVITDMRGTIREKPIREAGSMGPEEFVEKLRGIIEGCRQSYPDTTVGVAGIGVAMPVNYNLRVGEDLDPPLEKWRGIDAEAYLREQIPGIPITVISTAAAGAIGEVHFGDDTPETYLAYLHGAWKLKMDFYKGGTTYSSEEEFTGLIGETIVGSETGPDGKTVYKTLEDEASIKAVCRRLYPGGENRYEEILDLIRRQKYGDPEVSAAVTDVLDHLAVGIYNIIKIFRPEKLCIGGYLGLLLGRGFLEPLCDRVDALLGGTYPVRERIACSRLGLYSVAFGCVSWVRDNMISYLFD